MAGRTKPALAYRLVANDIRDRILGGAIKPGEPLPSESELARQLSVNRSTIREGIRLLEENGLVRRYGGKRLFASVPQRGDLSLRMRQALMLQALTFRELWEAEMAIEPPIAAAAALRAEPSDIEALQQNLQRMRAAYVAGESLVALDVEFHALLAQAAHNRALLMCRDPLSLLFYPAYGSVMTLLNAAERMLVAHETIVEAIRHRDEATARDWAIKHTVDFRRGYELANLDLDQPVPLRTGGAEVFQFSRVDAAKDRP